MKQRWVFRCYPTAEQEAALAQTFGCTRFVYNRFLHERTAAFIRGERMNYPQSSSALTVLKRDPEYAWLNEASSVPLQQSLRQLQTAFRNFFEKRSGYPSFKRKEGKQSAEYTLSAFKFDVGNQRLVVAKIGRLRIKWSRRIDVGPSTVTIIRKPSGRYFVSLVVDVQPVTLPETGQSVGIDFGLRRLAMLSTGHIVRNPKYSYRMREKLAGAQKILARKKKGSNRRKKAMRRVARIHEKIFNCRDDNQKQLAWSLLNRFDTIYVEDLNLRGMVKNHAVARSVSDASIGGYIRAIEQKAAMVGKTVVKIDRWFPSTKMCSTCGTLHDMPLGKEWMVCACGNTMDRDLNAARNILAAGQVVTAQGDDVRAA